MKDRDNREMYLTPDAEAAAEILAQLGARFTSGHRDMVRQAHAMAVNTSLNRKWVGATYRRGGPVQLWIDQHPDVVTVEALTEGIYQVIAALPGDQQISHHLRMPCPCFDIEPRTDTTGERIYQAIRTLPNLTKFLEREGGLLRWHVEFLHEEGEGAKFI